MIKHIALEDLRKMEGKEGLVLQGCGGDTQEWLDGVNDLFTKECILLHGTKFEHCSVFKNEYLTCVLLPFEGVKLNMGRLAMWRLQTHGAFGGTWLSDYVENKLGGFVRKEETIEKPNCPLIGADGNIFNLMGIASKTLREHGKGEDAKAMCERIRGSKNYYEALNIIGEYVNITDGGEESITEGMQL